MPRPVAFVLLVLLLLGIAINAIEIYQHFQK